MNISGGTARKREDALASALGLGSGGASLLAVHHNPSAHLPPQPSVEEEHPIRYVSIISNHYHYYYFPLIPLVRSKEGWRGRLKDWGPRTKAGGGRAACESSDRPVTYPL
jgi:hypothetical protein